MASFYSRPADYGNYTQPINLDLVNFVLSSKQQKYDYNLAKLEDKITNQLGNLDLARTQDKEYFLNRAANTLNSMGDISKLDYSKNGVTKQIDSKLNSIIDTRVLNDVVSTRNYRSFQNTLQEKQKKGDGSYNTTNAAYAMEVGGVNSWLKGADSSGNAVDSLGTIAYQDYVDVNEELRDISENLDDYAHVVKKFTRDGMYFVNQSGKELKASEVKSIASQLLSDKAKGQMKINGWGNYDGGAQSSSAADVAGRFSDFANSQYSEIDKDIADYQMRADALQDTNPEIAQGYTDAVESMTAYKHKLKSSYDKWIDSPDKARYNMATTMETETTLTNFGKTFAINDVGDPVYTANPVAQAEVDNKIKTAMLALKTKEFNMEYGSGAINAVDAPYANTDKDTATQVPTEIKENLEQLQTLSNSAYNRLTQTQKQAVDNQANQSTEGTLEERRLAVMDSAEYRGVVDPELLSQARDMQRELQVKQEVYGEALDKSFERVEGAKAVQAVDVYYNNKGILMAHPTTGKKISVADFLKERGVNEGQGSSLLEEKHKETYYEVLKSYYADKILSETAESFSKETGAVLQSMASVLPIGGFAARTAAGSILEGNGEQARETIMLTNRLTELFVKSGLDRQTAENQTKAYLVKAKEAGAYNNLSTDTLVGSISGTLAGASAVAFGTGVGAPAGALLAGGALAAHGLNPDSSVKDDATLNQWITMKDVDKYTGSELNNSVHLFSARQRAFVVTADTKVGKDLAARVQSAYVNLNPEESVIFKVNPGMSMSVQSMGGGIARVSGLNVTKNLAHLKHVDVPINSLPAAVLQQIDFEKAKIAYAPETMSPMSRSFMFPTVGDIKQMKFVERKLGMEPHGGSVITKEATLEAIQSRYATQLGSTDKPTELGTAVESMLNATNLVGSIIEIDGEFHKQLGVKKGREVIPIFRDTYAIDPSNYETAVRNMEIVPTLFVRDILSKSLEAQRKSPKTTPAFLKQIQLHYGAKQ